MELELLKGFVWGKGGRAENCSWQCSWACRHVNLLLEGVPVFFEELPFHATVALCCRQGGKAGSVQKCNACRGRGVRIMIRQLAPGMVQQMQSVCSDCNGEGRPASAGAKCAAWILLESQEELIQDTSALTRSAASRSGGSVEKSFHSEQQQQDLQCLMY